MLTATRDAPCRCGSGRTTRECHGQRRPSPREARRLVALAVAHDVGFLFPFLRPEDEVVLAFADRAAEPLAQRAAIPPSVVEEGGELLSPTERTRLLQSFVRRYRRRWAAVVDAVGESAPAERALVLSAVRAAIAERCLPPRPVLKAVERNRRALDTPPKALLFLVEPAYVWPLEDAYTAIAAVGRKPAPADLMSAIAEVATARLDESHRRRVRELADHLARRLPLARLPRTSALLAQACAEVAEDDSLADELARESLGVYAVRIGAEYGRVGAVFD
jgi:hypothetical protein